MKLDFSIIIPTFNVEKYIRECLDSILISLKKANVNFEIICIDDHSTDATMNEIKSIAESCSKIKVFNSRGKGPGVCRNQGLENSKGEYVLFVDSDDLVSSELFSSLYEVTQKLPNKEVIVFGYRLFETTSNKTLFKCDLDLFSKTNILMGRAGLAVWNKCYKRHFLVENGICFREEVQVEDIDFVFRAALKVKSIFYLKGAFYHWRKREDSESRKLTEPYIKDYFKTLEIVRKLSVDLDPKAVERFFLVSYDNLLNKVNIKNSAEEIHFLKKRFCHTFLNEIGWRYLFKRHPRLSVNIILNKWEKTFSMTLPTLCAFLFQRGKPLLRLFLEIMKKISVFKIIRLLRKKKSEGKKTVQPKINSTQKVTFICLDENLSDKEISDIYFRFCWYFNPARNLIDQIVIPGFDDKRIESLPHYLSGEISLYQQNFKGVFSKGLKTSLDSSFHKVVTFSIRSDFKKKNFYLLDPKIKGVDSLYLSMFKEVFGEIYEDDLEERNRLKNFKSKLKSDKCYVLGTGPSLSEHIKYDFLDGDVIICNSIVGNKELLKKLKPTVCCCADPIFHAGYSSYAEKFRKDLRSLLDEFDPLVLVPKRDYHIYKTCFKDKENNFIPLEFVKESFQIKNDFKKVLEVEVTSNILTLFMLPVASFLYDKVNILGCDGRPLSDGDYFWGHWAKVQYSEELDEIKLAHPGFFKLDYNEYYLEHCAVVEKWISDLEGLGKVICSYSRSYIPALNKRKIQSVESFDQIYYQDILNHLEFIQKSN